MTSDVDLDSFIALADLRQAESKLEMLKADQRRALQ
jgi:hypothetical protein